MAVVLLDEFDGTAGAKLESRSPDVGSWYVLGPPDDTGISPELDGSGVAVHVNALDSAFYCQAYAGPFDLSSAFTFETSIKIIDSGSNWQNALVSFSIFSDTIGEFYFEALGSSSFSNTVDLYWQLRGSGFLDIVDHSESVSSLTLSDVISTKATFDATSSEFVVWLNGIAVATIDASGITQPEFSAAQCNFYMMRTDRVYPREPVFGVEFVRIADSLTSTSPPVASVRYKGVIVAGEDLIDVPISSWQSTLQSGAANYAQIVIPRASAYFEQVNSWDSFKIMARTLAADGTLIDEFELLNAPITNVDYDMSGRGADQVTLKGNWDGYTPTQSLPPPEAAKQIYGIQSRKSQGNGLAYRATLDLEIRPQQRIYSPDGEMAVEEVSFYVGPNQAYMDLRGFSYVGICDFAATLMPSAAVTAGAIFKTQTAESIIVGRASSTGEPV